LLASGVVEAAMTMLAELHPAPTPTADVVRSGGSALASTSSQLVPASPPDMLASESADVDFVYSEMCYVLLLLNLTIPAVRTNHNTLKGEERTLEADEMFAECLATCTVHVVQE
jgi:hypothetical protein